MFLISFLFHFCKIVQHFTSLSKDVFITKCSALYRIRNFCTDWKAIIMLYFNMLLLRYENLIY